MPTTTRGVFRYPALADNADVPEDIQALAEDIDAKILMWAAGTTAGRPAAAIAGRVYRETDGDRIALDMGSAWRKILYQTADGRYTADGDVSASAYRVSGTLLAAAHLSDEATLARLASPAFTGTPTAPTPGGGDNSTKLATTAYVQTALAGISSAAGSVNTLANRPSAASAAFKFFFANDQIVLYFSDGSSWFRMSEPAGSTYAWFKSDSAVPTGYVAYDGGTLPQSTGIYADIYAHLGSTLNKPDTRGRAIFGKGTHGDVDAMLDSEGEATVGNRTPIHNSTHSLTLPNHVHSHSLALPDHGHSVNPDSATKPGGSPGTGIADVQAGSPHYALAAASISVGSITSSPGINGSIGNPTTNPGVGGSVGPGGTRPNDRVPFLTGMYIAKL